MRTALTMADYKSLTADLARLKWDTTFDGFSTDDMVDRFYGEVPALIDHHVPRNRQGRTYAQPWVTAETARLRDSWNRAFRAWKCSGIKSALSHFLKLHEEFMQHCAGADHDYLGI